MITHGGTWSLRMKPRGRFPALSCLMMQTPVRKGGPPCTLAPSISNNQLEETNKLSYRTLPSLVLKLHEDCVQFTFGVITEAWIMEQASTPRLFAILNSHLLLEFKINVKTARRRRYNELGLCWDYWTKTHHPTSLKSTRQDVWSEWNVVLRRSCCG